LCLIGDTGIIVNSKSRINSTSWLYPSVLKAKTFGVFIYPLMCTNYSVNNIEKCFEILGHSPKGINRFSLLKSQKTLADKI